MNTYAPYFAPQSVSLGSLALAMAAALGLAAAIIAKPDVAYANFAASVGTESAVVLAVADALSPTVLEHDELSPLSCCSHVQQRD